MLSEFDPLMDFRCPHCHLSLRFRRLLKVPQGAEPVLKTHHGCPLCNGIIVERRHPAIANNWLWARFYMPGVILTTLGIFVPSLGWILPFAVATLYLGLAAIIIYMLRERWGWKRYAPVPEQAPKTLEA